jgi:hypothetical protein
MEKLDPAEVVRLYEMELMSIREIAKRFGRSYGAVHRIVAAQATPRPRSYRTEKVIQSVPCGSKRAYQRHLDRGEEPDEKCKQANREYTNEFNRRTGVSRARNRAYRQLTKSFPDVFKALLEEEMSKRPGPEDEGVSKQVWNNRARERAHRRLARLYPDIFQQILVSEKAVANSESQNAG